MAARQIAIGLKRAQLFHAEGERAHRLEEANRRLLMLDQARRQALRPDVELMDVAMPRLNGIEATLRIRRQWPTCVTE